MKSAVQVINSGGATDRVYHGRQLMGTFYAIRRFYELGVGEHAPRCGVEMIDVLLLDEKAVDQLPPDEEWL
jgi:hypothetical protein